MKDGDEEPCHSSSFNSFFGPQFASVNQIYLSHQSNSVLLPPVEPATERFYGRAPAKIVAKIWKDPGRPGPYLRKVMS